MSERRGKAVKVQDLEVEVVDRVDRVDLLEPRVNGEPVDTENRQ